VSVSNGESKHCQSTLIEEHGFTLVELLVGVSIMTVIVTVMASGLTQGFRGVWFQRSGLTSLDETRRILPTITQDLQVATATNLVNGAAPVASVSITSIDPETYPTPTTHTTTYSRSGNNLVRTVDGVPQTVARNIADVNFSVSGSTYTVELTARAEGSSSSEETSTWTVYGRVGA
jgi:prepilin-type N-terminal cleavage/methylation domain-containing protein